jgi:autophagy-related protein 9
VYGYYIGKGLYCICLERFLNLAYFTSLSLLRNRTIAFVVGFSTFLLACIDWAKIRGSHSLQEIIIPHGLSRCVTVSSSADMPRISYTATFVLWSFALFWMIKLIQYIVDIQRLLELQNFYYYLLEIREVSSTKEPMTHSRSTSKLSLGKKSFKD